MYIGSAVRYIIGIPPYEQEVTYASLVSVAVGRGNLNWK